MSLRSINAFLKVTGCKIFCSTLGFLKGALKVCVKLPLINYGIQNLARKRDVGYV